MQKIHTFSRGVICGFMDNYGVELTNLDCEDYHVHILFRATPPTEFMKFINMVKGRPPAVFGTSTRMN